jgi:hypothetical protein
MNSNVKNIALAGLFTGINILLVFLANYLVFIELLVLLFLPSFIAIFYLKTNIYSFLEFFLSSAIILTLIDFSISLQYFLPAIIVGGVFGLMIKYKVNGYYVVLILTLIENNSNISVPFNPKSFNILTSCNFRATLRLDLYFPSFLLLIT